MSKSNEFDLKVANKLIALRNSAKSRGIDFDLSFNKVKKILLAKRCYFTGVLLSDNPDDSNYVSFDRVDNNRGYVDDNVVACSKAFNQRKGNLTISEIVLLYNKTKKFANKK